MIGILSTANILLVSKIALASIGAFLTFRLLFFGFTYLQIKEAEFTITDLSLNLENDLAVEISLETTLTSPLSIYTHNTSVSLKYRENDQDFEFARVEVDDISISSFKSLSLKTKIHLKYLDLSKIPNLINSKEKFIELTINAYPSILMIPIPIPFKNHKIAIPEPETKHEESRVFENYEQAKNEFLRYLIELGDESKELGTTAKIPENHFLKVLKINPKDDAYSLTAVMNPIIKSSILKGLNINVENLSIILRHPLKIEVCIRKFIMNSNEYSLTVDLMKKTTENTSVLTELMKLKFGETDTHIQLEKIFRTDNNNKSVLLYQMESDSLIPKSGMIPVSKTKSKNSPLPQITLSDAVFEKGKMSIDLSLGTNKDTIFIGSLIHILLRASTICTELKLNDTAVCNFRIHQLNPLITLNSDGKSFKLFKFEFDFSEKNTLVLKKEMKVELKLKDFVQPLEGLNTISAIIEPGKPVKLKIGNEFIEFKSKQTSGNQVLDKTQYFIDHELKNSSLNTLLDIHSSFKTLSFDDNLKKMNFILPAFSIWITGNRIQTKHSFNEGVRIFYQPPDPQNPESSLDANVSVITSIFEKPSGIENPSDLLENLIGKTLNISIRPDRSSDIENTENSGELSFNIELDASIFRSQDSNPIESKLPSPQSKFNIKPEINIARIKQPETLGLSFETDQSTLYDVKQTAKIFNSIKIDGIRYTEEKTGLSIFVIPNPSIEIQLALSMDTLYILMAKKIAVNLCFIGEIEDIFSIKNNDKTMINKIEESKDTGISLDRVVRFIKSLDLETRKPKPAPIQTGAPTNQLSIGIGATINDDSNGLALNTLLKIPESIVPMKIPDFLRSILSDHKISIKTNDFELLNLSISFDSKDITIKLTVTVKNVNLLFRSDLPLDLFLNSTRILAVDIYSKNLLTQAIQSSHREQKIQIQNETRKNLPMMNIEFKNITSEDFVTTISLNVFSELLTLAIQRKTGQILNLLGLSNSVQFIDISMGLLNLPEVSLVARKNETQSNFIEKLISISNLKLSLKNKYPIIYFDSQYEPVAANNQILNDMYSSVESEVNYFKQNNVRMDANILKYPIEFSITLNTKGVEGKIITKDALSILNISIAESFTKQAYDKLKELMSKLLPSEKVEEKRKSISTEEKNFNFYLWLTPKKHGAFLMKLEQQINFIKKPLSIYVATNALAVIYIRLFGLQKDRILEKEHELTNTVNFKMFEERLSYPKGKYEIAPVGLFLEFDNKEYPLLKCYASKKDIPLKLSMAKKAYFSSLGNLITSTFINTLKAYREESNAELGIKVTPDDSKNWTGKSREEINYENLNKEIGKFVKKNNFDSVKPRPLVAAAA